MRWIWIDKFLEFRSGQFARAIKNLTLAEEHLHDHFPGYPVMPASLIIEGLAQTGGILVGEAGGFAEVYACPFRILSPVSNRAEAPTIGPDLP